MNNLGFRGRKLATLCGVIKWSDHHYLIVCFYYCFAVAEHLVAQHNSVKMLYERIRIILRYIKAVEEGD